MALPRQFEIFVHGPTHRVEMTGSNAAGDVQTLESQVSAAMDDVNTAVAGCDALSPADAQAWAAIYSGWQAFDQDLHGCIDNTPPDQYAPPTIGCITSYGLNWASAMSKLKNYQSQAQAWQSRVHAACAAYSPLPAGGGGGGGSTTLAQGSWMCRTFGWGCGAAGAPADTSSSSVGWPDALKWMAILGIIGVAAWYVGPIIATVAGVGAGAIRKRAEGTDEFEPVRVRGGDYSFGNFSREAPQLEKLQFGDVPKDEVLALINGVEG